MLPISGHREDRGDLACARGYLEDRLNMRGAKGKEAETEESKAKVGEGDGPTQAAVGDRSEGAAMDSSEEEGETGADRNVSCFLTLSTSK